MPDLDQLLDANRRHAEERAGVAVPEARPARHLAVLTCMDVRVDPLPALGLRLGDAHVLRNAGARVTEDVLRSLVLSTHVLGTDTVVVVGHTGCGLAGADGEELRRSTGSPFDLLAIADQRAVLRGDVDRLAAADYLPLREVVGLLYDVDTGRAELVTRRAGPAGPAGPGG